MWKALLGFAVFSALALYIFVKAGADVHIGGEQHGAGGEAAPTPSAASAAAATAASAASAASR